MPKVSNTPTCIDKDIHTYLNEFVSPTLAPGPRTRNIIENQLFRRQRSLKLEALQRQRSQYGSISDAADDDDVDTFDKVSAP